MTYFETSAVEGQNVNEVFTKVAQRHLQIKRGDDVSSVAADPSAGGQRKFDLEKQKKSQGKKSGCCK